jgi:peptidoglycan/xylan/chitin deacetylase (PgdA/CDA1 family)
MSAPHYYTRLAPFTREFAAGRPILTYHHVGPRKPGARIKGLYVSPRLFAAQLTELRANGFSTARFVDILAERHPGEKHVWVTFDDGFADVFDHALGVLAENGFRALVFLVSSRVGRTNEWQRQRGDISEPLMDDLQVRDWLAQGHEIGSHTRTHPRLTQLSPAAANEEIISSKKELEDRFGVPVEHFCYPYGDWNTITKDLVTGAGYTTACTTTRGVNTPGQTSPFELRRFTARYPSRNLKALWAAARTWIRGR